ncbi:MULTISPECIES: hypothetical protein [Acinetobacter]|uniref:Uncharacterized protein n=1 Tax=Acinetobacter higginsii TaxID=70347 RepID=N9RJI8_9GAMM|nr:MULTISPECIES: hypothetical protein [Acinetobacter]ENX58138.1 hypothetical protein F902_02538 [Acinetobacter higginsii]
MTRPLPETKFNELADALNGLRPNEILSEFKYARLNRLLSSLDGILPYDQYQILKAIIELHNDKIVDAYRIAQDVLSISETQYVLEQIFYIFDKVFSVRESLEVLNKIAQIADKLCINIKEVMPRSTELVLAFNDYNNKINFDWNLLHAKEVKNIIDLKTALDNLQVDRENLNQLNEIVHKILIGNNVRCISTEYFSMDGELLFLFYIDQPLHEITRLNDILLETCLSENILDSIYQLSYSYVPYDGVNEIE